MTPGVDTTDPLLYVQEAVADWLAGIQYFQGIRILKADQGNVLEQLEEIAAKTGLCIIIEPATPEFSYAGSTISMDCPVRIIVWESVTANRGAMGTRKHASAVAIEIVRALKPQSPAAPVVVTSAELTRDSGDACVYTLSTRRKMTV